MARKRKKQPEPAPTNKRWTLDNIEERARATGCEVLLGYRDESVEDLNGLMRECLAWQLALLKYDGKVPEPLRHEACEFIRHYREGD